MVRIYNSLCASVYHFPRHGPVKVQAACARTKPADCEIAGIGSAKIKPNRLKIR